ncbi:hypothetical protein MmTuc01_0569 [Methanosarcina mazei Tuc01]|uniref:Uncharacterized protein n=1 Tax=Methanosarcina mazei Tuc01 TaxID=1236903 RepID=M1QG73_METMZ|nr:hypothetical protein MmTuc01_0569 [Methanosarcina mazei Tuc01]
MSKAKYIKRKMSIVNSSISRSAAMSQRVKQTYTDESQRYTGLENVRVPKRCSSA